MVSVLNGVKAQVFLSNNSVVSLSENALLSVRGDIINQSNGFFYNSDTIDLIGNWDNRNGANAMDSSYRGIVRFTGINQNISGTYPTHFYHLSLENAGTKYMLNDNKSYGQLRLNDREFDVSSHTFIVRNAAAGAVENTTGFVSSTDDGGLERVINSVGSYLFPLGSSVGGTIYRPIVIQSKSSDLQIYKSGMTRKDPSTDGFDRTKKQRFLCQVNDQFYHRIYKSTATASVDIDFWYEPTDGNFNTISHWDNTSTWLKPDTAAVSTSGIYIVSRLYDWSDFDEKPFALAYGSAPFGLAGNDTSIYLGASVQLNTDNGLVTTWSPEYNISCVNCAAPVVKPDTSTYYYVNTERQDGCVNSDTIFITVIPSIDNLDVFIPNMITPNGDGANDVWLIKALEQFPNNEVIILNRWGDQIFVRKPYDNSFNGTLWGKELPEGTYYYLVKVHVNEDTKTFDGPLTIIR